MKGNQVKVSKFLSLVLRHQPEKIGLTLGEGGWVLVSDLLQACAAHGVALTVETLETVVATNDKKRFSFSADHLLIRANQGHSIDVELGLAPLSPPPTLFHGTAERFLQSIRKQGLIKGQRHHVHLSDNQQTAIDVGRRYGKPVILLIASERMNKDGHLFFRSDNGVWLTDHVPVNYLSFPDEGPER
ncbi:MAG TPA: RNA 2'-phosphotransferase [Pyrinomonadaceae bacterium]|nr:RNA 2'-phosphotransferase [Pyrinomonadaceae bacterium]